jgi:hypothetical protein
MPMLLQVWSGVHCQWITYIALRPSYSAPTIWPAAPRPWALACRVVTNSMDISLLAWSMQAVCPS